MRRRLRLDPTACTGHGLCADLLPERIELDEWGFPIIHGDVPAGLVYQLAEDGTLTSWQAGQPVGAAVPRAGGGLVLTARDGFLALDTSTGEVTPLAPVEADQPGTRMNDGSTSLMAKIQSSRVTSRRASRNVCRARGKKCSQKGRLRPTKFSHIRDCDS